MIRTNRGFVLVKNLIVLGHCDAEDDGRDVLETMNPFLSLRSLPADIEKPRRKKKEKSIKLRTGFFALTILLKMSLNGYFVTGFDPNIC